MNSLSIAAYFAQAFETLVLGALRKVTAKNVRAADRSESHCFLDNDSAQFAKVIETLDADPPGQQIAAAWIAKEKLRDALNLGARISGSTPCERSVRDRLFAFYDRCAQHEDIPELISLAKTGHAPGPRAGLVQ